MNSLNNFLALVWKDQRFFLFFVLVLLILSIFTATSLEAPATTAVSTLFILTITILLYVWPIFKRFKLTEKIYNLMEKEITKENANLIRLAIFGRNTFVWLLFSYAAVSILNITGYLLPQSFTYVFSDVVFFLALIFGLQTVSILRSFISGVSDSILNKAMDEISKKDIGE